MRRLTLLFPLLALVLCGFLAVSEAPSGPVVVQSIRLGEDAQGQTRLVLDIDGRPAYRIGAKGDIDPEIVVELEDVDFRVLGLGAERQSSGTMEGRGHIGRLSYAPQLLRISLRRHALPTRSFILPPSGDIRHHRLVIDLDHVGQDDFAGAAASFDPRSTGDAEPVLLARVGPVLPPSIKPIRIQNVAERVLVSQASSPTDEPRSKPIIVLDPGHGGYEPGAVGVARTKEKDITLAYSKDLKLVLERRGYDVRLTRSDDSYVEHANRIQLARTEGADLFMSIHADSHEDHSLRGASVYTLSERRSDKMANELREDGEFVLFDVEISNDDGVGDILLDLAQSNARQSSDRLADALVASMKTRMPLLKNPKRRGALLVLLSPDVPAVLVELAFLSNPRDEANLNNATWRRQSVTAIADGIDDYFDAEGLETRLAGGTGRSG
ncbi:MAG: N-acetylmuramoyl-L-alanine amidase [Pseudomonadota bacterium]